MFGRADVKLENEHEPNTLCHRTAQRNYNNSTASCDRILTAHGMAQSILASVKRFYSHVCHEYPGLPHPRELARFRCSWTRSHASLDTGAWACVCVDMPQQAHVCECPAVHTSACTLHPLCCSHVAGRVVNHNVLAPLQPLCALRACETGTKHIKRSSNHSNCLFCENCQGQKASHKNHPPCERKTTVVSKANRNTIECEQMPANKR